MGVKRPLEAEVFSEISFKQPKPIDYNEKLTLNAKDFSSQASAPKAYSPGVGKLCLDGNHENFGIDDASPSTKEYSNVTSSSEEEAENEEASSFINFPLYFDLSIPRKPPAQFEDPYAHLFNSSPRKEIPIGSNYQAEVPEWDSNSDGRDLFVYDYSLGKEISTGPSQRAEIHKCEPSDIAKDFSRLKNSFGKEEELKLMGTCIIPMPSLDDSDMNRLKVGSGRTDCSCLDKGSTRCVHQHVKEARETLGEEIFTKLGFYEMGEEVAGRWNPDEEQAFHEVIYSNPASHGTNFWKVLSNVFPTRSKKEIVSYYFNVFMLWKRAVQNRSYTLRVDSDDDEDPEFTHPNNSMLDRESDDDEDFRNSHAEFHLAGKEDHHAIEESFKDHDLDVGWVDKFEPELLNGGEGEENGHNNHETPEPENLTSLKVIDCNDGNDHNAFTVGDDAVNLDGERIQEFGKETEKSQEHRNLDS